MLEHIKGLLDNDVFGGVVGGSLVVSVMFLLKGVPKALFTVLKHYLTTEVSICSEDPSFQRVSEWLSSLDYTNKAKRLRLSVEGDNGSSYWSPGLGYHLIRHKGRFLLLHRTEKTESGSHWKRREDIRMLLLGSNPQAMHDLLAEATSTPLQVRQKTEIHTHRNGYWRLAGRHEKRRLDTVILPTEQKQRILSNIDRFLNSRSTYLTLGIPYRMGFLFEGPPGGGKTSLVMALAAHYSLPVYALHLGSLKGDMELIEAVAGVPEKSILLIEDIDAATTTSSRTKKAGEPDTDDELSLSGLLNVLDGTFAKEGRILVMTTNHPENIDPALIRPGRADHREHIAYAGEEEILAMCCRFLGEEKGRAYAQTLKSPLSPSELQPKLLAEI